jgi:hypothetical protein
MEVWRDKYVLPAAPPTVADVVYQLRDAFAYTLTRASQSTTWCSDEWFRCIDAARHVAPRHPALPPADGQLTDSEFLGLFKRWLEHVKAGGGDDLPADLFGCPPPSVWDRFKGEVAAAWQAGTSPAAWKARQPIPPATSADIHANGNGMST